MTWRGIITRKAQNLTLGHSDGIFVGFSCKKKERKLCLPQLENWMDTLNRMMLFCVVTVFRTHTRSAVYSCSVSQGISQPGLFCLQLQNANSVLITILAAGKIVFHILFFPFCQCGVSNQNGPPRLLSQINWLLLNPTTISNVNQMQVIFHQSASPWILYLFSLTVSHF